MCSFLDSLHVSCHVSRRDMPCIYVSCQAMQICRLVAPGEVMNDLTERHLKHGSKKFVLCFMTRHDMFHAMRAWLLAAPGEVTSDLTT